MSIVQLHSSPVAVCPCEDLPAVLSAPGHSGLRGTPGGAGEGDIFPDVSRHINRCLREQWARCRESEKSEEWSFHCVHFEGSISFVWSYLQPPGRRCRRRFLLSCWPHSYTGRRRPPGLPECGGSHGGRPAPQKEQSLPQAHLGTQKNSSFNSQDISFFVLFFLL